ncbi:DinQ-like type I toxin DqlB [Escherichia coli]
MLIIVLRAVVAVANALIPDISELIRRQFID